MPSCLKPVVKKPTKKPIKKKTKRRVQFCTVIHKKLVTPLPGFEKGKPRLPEDLFVGEDLGLSFTELTDNTILSMSIDCPIELSEESDACLSSEEPDLPRIIHLWTDAFLPQRESDMINKSSMFAFKTWLDCWRKRLTELAKAAERARKEAKEPPKKKRKRKKRDEDSDSDPSYEDELTTTELCSTFVLSGPTGCGKTSFVHYYAKEYGFNVIELSASEKRTGIAMKNKLQGAMENFGVYGPGDIRSSFFAPQKSDQSALKRNLVLIDDADIVYKSDSGFWSTLAEFSACSKIPIVLTCTNPLYVVGFMQNSAVEQEKFCRRDRITITRHLYKWISNENGGDIEAEIVEEIVKNSKQDIRKALNNIQFNGGRLPVKGPKPQVLPTLSSKQLAEFDAILTKCREFENDSNVRWNAKVSSNIDYVPEPCPFTTYYIPPVDNNNERFIDDLSNLMSTSIPSTYAEYDKKDERLSAMMQSYCGVDAPMYPAIYDVTRRCDPGPSTRIAALYELPAFAVKHRIWCEKISKRKSGRRVLHPFNDVDNSTSKALDRFGNLKNTIDEYLNLQKASV